MRLGQLARSLETTTKEIVEYLATKDIEVKDHPNVKLSDENEQLVTKEFGQAEEVEIIVERSVQAEPEIKTDIQKETIDEKVTEEATEEKTSQTETTDEANEEMESSESLEVIENEEVDQDPYEGVEIIKAPKIELPGLKVVGKIDLPEPKQIVKEEPEEEHPAEAKEESEPKVRYAKHHRRNSRPRLTEEQREERRLRNKKAKERRIKEKAEQDKLAEEKRIKNKKKKHYHEKLQKSTNKINGSIKIKKPTPKSQEAERPKPKTILGKFWRWLNT